MSTPLMELEEKLLPVFRRHRITRAIVFGSFARGEASRHSDLDLILVQRTNQRFLDRYDGLLSELARAVSDRDLDVLIYTPAELSAMTHRPFIRAALREGRVIYESN
jgi:predicted nucleotidyltransferase